MEEQAFTDKPLGTESGCYLTVHLGKIPKKHKYIFGKNKREYDWITERVTD